MHKIGLDVGRSMVKATCNGDAVVEFPPLVAAVGASRALLDGKAERLEVAWEGTRWLAGESVRGGGGARWVTDERKAGTDSLVLSLAAIGKLGELPRRAIPRNVVQHRNAMHTRSRRTSPSMPLEPPVPTSDQRRCISRNAATRGGRIVR